MPWDVQHVVGGASVGGAVVAEVRPDVPELTAGACVSAYTQWTLTSPPHGCVVHPAGRRQPASKWNHVAHYRHRRELTQNAPPTGCSSTWHANRLEPASATRALPYPYLGRRRSCGASLLGD